MQTLHQLFPLDKSKAFFLGMSCVSFCYVIIYGLFLWYMDGLPYVIDGNESFSSLIHAYNLYHGDLTKSFGLTDETFHLSQAAHPMVHSHQGNWPRIFAFLLYALGARTIESQIIITTFSIGFLAILFMYYYFSKITKPLFAVLVCLIFMTDYVLFTQWQVNTYRVWYVFFVFSSLLCVEGLKSERARVWFGLTVLNYACLFYGELIFATFIAMWAGLYTIAIFYREPKKILLGGFTQALGLFLGFGILVLQLISYLGWENFTRDVYLTFYARNHMESSTQLKSLLSNFYGNINLVFFYNVQDAASFRTFINFLRSFLYWGTGVHSPYLACAVLMVFFVWIWGVLENRWFKNIGQHFQGFYKTYSSKAFACLFFLVFVLSVISTDDFFKNMRVEGLFFQALISFLYILMIRKIGFSLDRSSDASNQSCRLFLIILFLIFSTTLIILEPKLFNASLNQLWDTDTGAYAFLPFLTFMVLSIALVDKQRLFWISNILTRSNSILFYLLSGFLAYIMIYLIATGYVYSGYLTRYCSFHVFLIDVVVAIAFYTVITLTLAFAKKAYTYWPIEKKFFALSLKNIVFLSLPKCFMLLCLSFTLLVIFISQWIYIQVRYLSLLPANEFHFVKLLKEPPYFGKSIVSNSYVLPFSIQANSWGIHDSGIPSGKVSFGKKGYSMPLDTEYVWFADRKVNPAYQKPELFVCYYGQDLNTALYRYKYPNVAMSRCTQYPLLRQAMGLEKNRMGHKLLARDTSGSDAWAIVEINWDFPPYLVALDQQKSNERIGIAYSNKGDPALSVHYRYTQQSGQREKYSTIQLHQVLNTKYGCRLSKPLTTTKAHAGMSKLKLPLDNTPHNFVVSVIPESETKKGDIWLSPIFKIENETLVEGTSCRRWFGEEEIIHDAKQ